MAFSFAGAALAAHEGPLVAPTQEDFPGGDPQCPAGTTGFRWTPAESGDEKGGVTVTISGDEVSFEADPGTLVAIAVVKGGTDQNVYDYTGFPGGGVDHDNGLVAPDNASGDPAGVSHVDLCVFEGEVPTPTPTLPPTTTIESVPGTPSGTSLGLVLGVLLLVAGGLTAYAMRPRRSLR